MTEQLVFMNGQPTQSLQLSHSSGKVAYWVGAQYATGDQWSNNSKKNEGTEPKQKQHPVVDVTDERSKVLLHRNLEC